jgi:hypothetical protein
VKVKLSEFLTSALDRKMWSLCAFSLYSKEDSPVQFDRRLGEYGKIQKYFDPARN